MKRALPLLLLIAGCSGEAPTPTPSLKEQIPITIGKAYDRGGPRLPVEIENRTGRDLAYVQITCAFRDESGTLIESAIENWTDVPAGGRVSGEVLPEARTVASIDCVPSV
ncbi:MAG: FxLYD domain-containing protein [Brevundimonas sp.]